VDVQGLDFIKGTRVELEFVGPDANSIYIHNWDPQVHCTSQGESVCKDVTEDTGVDEQDFLTLIGECGSSADLASDGTSSRACLDGPFSPDGYVDTADVISWDWITYLQFTPTKPLNYCFDIPMVGGAQKSPMNSQANPLPSAMSSLLITGKQTGQNNGYSGIDKMQDSLYAFNGSDWMDSSSPSASGARRLNGKLITDNQGMIYQLNSEHGLVRLAEPNTVIISPAPNGFPGVAEPRYPANPAATVYVGIYGSQDQWAGRPILDAAFDPSNPNLVYVVPVVVDPDSDDEPYTAAAKLQITGPGTYSVDTIYDEPPDTDDNQYRNALREIEVDADGNVYVINSHELNESDILWKFHTDDTITRVPLGIADSALYIPGPTGMCVSGSGSTGRLYLASSQKSVTDPTSSTVYGLSLSDLTVARTITVNNMHHITDITEDPATNDLWISGFNMYNIPSGVPPRLVEPFYKPYLAQIQLGEVDVTAVALESPAEHHDLALPLSIIWTAEVCGGADFDGSGQVEIEDLRWIAADWLKNDSPVDLNNQDPVDLLDWQIFAEYWLSSGCN
jgi:hypothetical protein